MINSSVRLFKFAIKTGSVFYLNFTVFFLSIQLAELGLLLVIIDGADEDDDDNSSQNGHALDPRYLGIDGVIWGKVAIVSQRWFVLHSKVLVYSQGNGYDGSN